MSVMELSNQHSGSVQDVPPMPAGEDRVIPRLLLVAAVYFFALWFTQAIRVLPDQMPIFWPQTGWALSAFIVVPRRSWLPLAAALLISAALFGALLGRGLVMQVAGTLADVAVAAVAGYIYRRYRPDTGPADNLSALRLFLPVAVAAAIAVSLLSTLAGVLSSGPETFWPGWGLALGAAAAGIGLIGVPGTVLLEGGARGLPRYPSLGFAIAAILTLLVTAIPQFDRSGDAILFARISLPFLVWVAIRHTSAEAVTLLLVSSLLEIWLACWHSQASPILPASPERIVLMQTYLTIQAATIFMLCSVMKSRASIEQRAEQYAARLESMINAVPDAILTIDERGSINFFSPAAERMFLYRSDEVIGRNIKMLMPQPYRGEHDSYLRHYLETGQKRIIGIGRIVVAERKDGTTFPIELAVGEAQLQGQHMFTGLIRDISEKQDTERRLHELQADLLHVSRLSAMGELASALAHELNQPLTAINNYLLAASQLMKRGPEDLARASEIVGKSIDQAVRAGQIIRQLRNFVERREVEREVVDLDKVIDEASALAFIGLKEKGIRVVIQRAGSNPLISIDKVQIQQVLINLIRNAVDAMETAARRDLTINTTMADGEIRIDVIDTGSGISPEVADKLFQPFTSTKPSGMGVGLSISRTIVEAHDGRLWCEPNPGGGTIFHLYLPYEENRASQP